MSTVHTSFDLNASLATIRKLADVAKLKASAETKTANAEIPTGAKLPTMVIANHAKASAVSDASKNLIRALESGALVVKGVGKVLKSGDVSIRIGAPLASLEFVVGQAQAKAAASRDARKVKRYREKFPTESNGLEDADVLALANAHAAKVEAEKATKKAAPAPAQISPIAQLAAQRKAA